MPVLVSILLGLSALLQLPVVPFERPTLEGCHVLTTEPILPAPAAAPVAAVGVVRTGQLVSSVADAAVCLVALVVVVVHVPGRPTGIVSMRWLERHFFSDSRRRLCFLLLPFLAAHGRRR